MSTFYIFSGGIAILSGIAYIFRTWRALYIASSIPSVLFLIILLPFVSESPPWCLMWWKMGRAMKSMLEISKMNGKNLPVGVILALDQETNESKTEQESKEAVAGSLLDILRSPLTRILLFLVVAMNFLCSIVYYGLSLNVVNLGTNLYLNVFLNAAAEMPAFLITAVLFDRFGRKALSIGTQWFSGVFCVVGALLNGYGIQKTVRMVRGILGIFGMAGT